MFLIDRYPERRGRVGLGVIEAVNAIADARLDAIGNSSFEAGHRFNVRNTLTVLLSLPSDADRRFRGAPGFLVYVGSGVAFIRCAEID